ncbi:MAG TPA: class I fructose-bisphosphate aldolase [Geminicoccaceae bacterium]
MQVTVHHLEQARAVVEVARELGVEVELRSAPDAAAYAGVGYLHALEALVGRGLLVDCGDDAGLVMAGLRTGCRKLAYTGPLELFQRLADMAGQVGAVLRHEPGVPEVVALEPDDDRARILSRLSRLTAAPAPRPGPEAAAPTPKELSPMQITPKVKEILSWYEGDNPGVKGNLARLLMTGRLAGSGKLVILPVDQGYEHGPARSFAANPPAYDPHYLYQLALDAGLSGYAAPLGLLEQGADTYAGQIPTILKMNSANSLAATAPDQAVTASVKDALRLGCVGVGFTIYPGSDACYDQMEELREIIREAKSCGLAAVVWSYPRGGKVSKEGETALDICGYAAHMAALMGANIIKVKPPSDELDLDAAKKVYEAEDIDRSTLAARVRHVMNCAFAGKRLVVFSGGEATTTEGLLNEIRGIRDGGGSGSIIGRNSFRRPKPEALALLDEVIKIYLDEA